MSTKPYFAYVRVSTARQGQTGTSLVEQRSAIERHAKQKDLRIIHEFQEQETAAKGGRPIFRQMMEQLQDGRASGVIMHKIDRSARNLKDWAELGELIDAGIDVHFANENLDLYSRGGRLSADIQAVVAADYIRNLKEEVRKGFYGRIKQGFYPMPAPIGYLNQGGGKAKTIDPCTGPLIKETFLLYATGRYSLDSLAAKMNELGLRRRSNQPLSRNHIASILHNVFYTGIIRIKLKEEYFAGCHEPIISKQLFDKVQKVLSRKLTKTKGKTHLAESFLFRGFLICLTCGRLLSGEKQKGHIYYRCHTKDCPEKTIREERVRTSVWSLLKKFEPVRTNNNQFRQWLLVRQRQLQGSIAVKRSELMQKLNETRNVLGRLTDLLITDAIDNALFLKRKNTLIATEIDLQQKLASLEVSEKENLKELEKAFDFTQTAALTFQYAPYARKREVITTMAEQLVVHNRSVKITVRESFAHILRQRNLETLPASN